MIQRLLSQRGGAAEHEARAVDLGLEGFCSFKQDVEFASFRHDSLVCSDAEVEMG